VKDSRDVLAVRPAVCGGLLGKYRQTLLKVGRAGEAVGRCRGCTTIGAGGRRTIRRAKTATSTAPVTSATTRPWGHAARRCQSARHAHAAEEVKVAVVALAIERARQRSTLLADTGAVSGTLIDRLASVTGAHQPKLLDFGLVVGFWILPIGRKLYLTIAA
jgi:hypothetical protein